MFVCFFGLFVHRLKKFCDYDTEQNKIDKIKNALAKINVDYSVFEKCKKDLKLIDKEQLDDKQKKKLRHLVLHGVKYSFINYSKVTTAIDDIKEHYDVKSEEKSYDRKILTAKIVTSVLCAFGFAMIVFTGTGFSLGKLAQIISWLCMIAWNICQSLSTGTKSITIHRANYYKKLRTFLEEFFSSEYADTSVDWERPNIKDDEEENANMTLIEAIKNQEFIKGLANAMKNIDAKEKAKAEKEKHEIFDI